MATVTLTRTWVSLASDLSQSVVVDRHASAAGGRTRSLTGEVRAYASGRLRAVNGSSRPATVPLTFRTNDLTLIETLNDWTGLTVLVRDPRGRREWCVFHAVPENDLDSGWVEVALTLNRVTYAEAV